ncbi:hypothetical protein LC724_08695 [Blautia sp. RD014234]|nr:hypothetical protein [Blautia parvula]
MEEERAVLDMDIRYPITAKAEKILEQLGRTAGEYGFSIRSFKDDPPSYVDKNTPFVTCLTNAYEEIVKDGKKPYVMGGGHMPERFRMQWDLARGFSLTGKKQDCQKAMEAVTVRMRPSHSAV